MRAIVPSLLVAVTTPACGDHHVLPCFCDTETEGAETTEEDGDTTGLPPPTPMPDGSACTQDAGCTGRCFIVPILGGVCGECAGDADCAGGCTPPDPIRETGSVCNNGEFGAGCESSGSCAPGLECAEVIDLIGVVTLTSCSECTRDSDCGENEHCGPTDQVFDLFNPGGLRCIGSQSIPTGGACTPGATTGDNVCETGFCTIVDFEGLATFGVCSDCESDADCSDSSCVPASYDIETRTMTAALCG